MSLRTILPSCLLSVACATTPGADDPDAGLPVISRDVVALSQGTSLSGRSELAVEHGSFRYLFADEAGQRAFEAEPQAYEVPFGDGCARMGPLSGGARPEFEAVVDGRLYLFASAACRDTFTRSPDEFLEWQDALPSGDAQARAEGRQLLDLAIDGLGGRGALERWEVCWRERRWEQVQGAQTWQVEETVLLTTYGELARINRWGDDDWTQVLAGDEAVAIDPDGRRTPFVSAQRRALGRRFLAEPLWLLTRCLEADVVAVHLGDEERAGRPRGRVAVHVDGATVELLVDRDDGRVVELAHTGRGPDARVTRVVRRLSEHRPVKDCCDGLTLVLPHAEQVFAGGEPVERWSGRWELRLECGSTHCLVTLDTPTEG